MPQIQGIVRCQLKKHRFWILSVGVWRLINNWLIINKAVINSVASSNKDMRVCMFSEFLESWLILGEFKKKNGTQIVSQTSKLKVGTIEEQIRQNLQIN